MTARRGLPACLIVGHSPVHLVLSYLSEQPAGSGTSPYGYGVHRSI